MAEARPPIADDYTGASDLANTLSRQGLRTVQVIGVPGATQALPPRTPPGVGARPRPATASAA